MGLQEPSFFDEEEEEFLSKKKRKYAGKNYAGVQRTEKNPRCGERYEKTPILYELPEIGSKVRILERVIGVDDLQKTYRIHYVEHRNTVYEVRGYTQGIDNPLQSNNFLVASYTTKSGVLLSASFRAVDISLGIYKVIKAGSDEDEEFLTDAKINITKKRTITSIVNGRA